MASLSEQITYLKYGGGYQLSGDYKIQTGVIPDKAVWSPRIVLSHTGMLTIKDGYCWDGASGPVIDRKSNMRAGLVHDSLYELMRRNNLSHKYWRAADFEFAKLMREDGGWAWVVKLDLAGLKLAAGKYAHPSQRKKRHTAP